MGGNLWFHNIRRDLRDMQASSLGLGLEHVFRVAQGISELAYKPNLLEEHDLCRISTLKPGKI
jgi:hypothetical protein